MSQTGAMEGSATDDYVAVINLSSYAVSSSMIPCSRRGPGAHPRIQ
jgi:hypothetical protein